MSKFNSVCHVHGKDRKHLKKNLRKQELGIPYRLLEWREDGGEDLNSSRVVGELRYTWKMQARLPALHLHQPIQTHSGKGSAADETNSCFPLVALWLNWEQKPPKTEQAVCILHTSIHKVKRWQRQDFGPRV